MKLLIVMFLCFAAKIKVSAATVLPDCSPGNNDAKCCPAAESCPSSYYQSVAGDSITCQTTQTTTPADDTTTTTTDNTTTTTTNDTTTTTTDDTTTAESTGTDEAINVTTQATPTASDVNSTSSTVNVTNSTPAPIMICVRCDPACKTCNGSGDGHCIHCKFIYNDTCVEQCPVGYKPSDLSHCVADDPSDGDNMYIIIGAAAGGGALIIVVVVVVVVVCCVRKRRGRPKRTAMSDIIETRHEEDKSPNVAEVGGRSMGQNVSKRPNYENTSGPQPDFARKVQEKTDDVLRYTKDPTLGRNETMEASGHSIYGNAAMVQLNSKTDLTNMGTHTMELALDREELDTMPTAPAVPAPQQKKFNILKRLSLKSKKQDKRKLTQQEDTSEGDYLPMGSMVIEDDQVPVYEAPDGPDEIYENQAVPDGTGEEEYENTAYRTSEATEEDYENTTFENPYENVPFTSKQK